MVKLFNFTQLSRAVICIGATADEPMTNRLGSSLKAFRVLNLEMIPLYLPIHDPNGA